MPLFARLLLVLLLAAPAAFASVVTPAVWFDNPGAESLFEPIKFRTDDSGRRRLPTSPPTLTQADMLRVARVMSGQTGAAPGIDDALVYRVVNVMARADMVSGTPITRAEWNRRLDAFEVGFRASFPATARPTAAEFETGVDHLLRNMIMTADDPHTQYLNRNAWRQLLEHQRNAGFVGIGAHIGPDPLGVKVSRPLPGSPAAAAVLSQNGRPVATGLRRDDIIIAIDRVPAAGMPLDQAVQRLRGVPNTTVSIRVLRAGQEYDATVTRRHVSSPNSFSRFAAPSIGYVYFASFTDGVDAEVFTRIHSLRASGARKLIIDVRGNPGGSLPMVQSIASEFLRDRQEITTTRAQGIVIERATVDGDGMFRDMPVAVLIDTHSASASEILALVLQDHARATVVGWQSYGKGTFQSVIPTEIPVERLGVIVGRAPDGTGAKITGGGWFGPSGRSINGRHDAATGRNVPGSGGVRPDIAVNVTDSEQAAVMDGIMNELYSAGPAAPYDPVLGAAVTALSRP